MGPDNKVRFTAQVWVHFDLATGLPCEYTMNTVSGNDIPLDLTNWMQSHGTEVEWLIDGDVPVECWVYVQVRAYHEPFYDDYGGASDDWWNLECTGLFEPLLDESNLVARRPGDDEDERYPDHPVDDVLYPVPF